MAASVVAFVLQASAGLGGGAKECLAAPIAISQTTLANGGKTRPPVETFAMGTSVIAVQDRKRHSTETATAAPVSYIRCLRKVS